MSDNNAVIKIVADHTKEYNELNAKYKKIGEKLLFRDLQYAKLLDEKTNIDAKCYVLRKQNKNLRDITIRFERDNKRLQESLDGAQREIERLIEKYERVGMMEESG